MYATGVKTAAQPRGTYVQCRSLFDRVLPGPHYRGMYTRSVCWLQCPHPNPQNIKKKPQCFRGKNKAPKQQLVSYICHVFLCVFCTALYSLLKEICTILSGKSERTECEVSNRSGIHLTETIKVYSYWFYWDIQSLIYTEAFKIYRCVPGCLNHSTKTDLNHETHHVEPSATASSGWIAESSHRLDGLRNCMLIQALNNIK